MDYALNKVTNELVCADKAVKSRCYQCPVCKAKVDLRVGKVINSYFAHRKGHGTPACDNFVPSHSWLHAYEDIATQVEKKRIELFLLINKESNQIRWSLELIIPPCRECKAKITIDVGGRTQTLDMRAMDKSRHLTADPSFEPYRIVSYSGTPDYTFFNSVEKECPGLPKYGAAVFTSLKNSEIKGFPRARELRLSETFAFLWKEPISPCFPDELFVGQINERNGWHLAFVTLPDCISPDCTIWLQKFTRLSILPPSPSITTVWPFLTKNSSINEIESIQSGISLIAAEMMPLGLKDHGPTMLAQTKFKKVSAVGIEPSPAFFVINSDVHESIEITNSHDLEINKIVSFSLHLERYTSPPQVEMVFSKSDNIHQIIPLHHRLCSDLSFEVRQGKANLEYISMPDGIHGTLRVDDGISIKIIDVASSNEKSPHNINMCLPPSDVLRSLVDAVTNVACNIELEFGGLGRLTLSTPCKSTMLTGNRGMSQTLRNRLLSFMFQLDSSTSISVYADDAMLLKHFFSVKPKSHLISHYRILMHDILKCNLYS